MNQINRPRNKTSSDKSSSSRFRPKVIEAEMSLKSLDNLHHRRENAIIFVDEKKFLCCRGRDSSSLSGKCFHLQWFRLLRLICSALSWYQKHCRISEHLET